MADSEIAQDLNSHISELRTRVIHSLIVLVVLSSIGFYFSQDILGLIQADLGLQLNALTAYETIYTQITISLIFGFITGLPAILYQLLKFMEPGLKPKEYRLLRNYLPLSILLFGIGSLFSYNFIVKKSLSLFMNMTESAGVQSVWSLQRTIGYAIKLSTVSGMLFQLPIVSMILAKAGLINSEMMNEYRAHFFIAVLIIAAVATPPDLVTQILVTLPVLGLYQVSIFLVSRIE